MLFKTQKERFFQEEEDNFFFKDLRRYLLFFIHITEPKMFSETNLVFFFLPPPIEMACSAAAYNSNCTHSLMVKSLHYLTMSSTAQTALHIALSCSNCISSLQQLHQFTTTTAHVLALLPGSFCSNCTTALILVLTVNSLIMSGQWLS